MRSSNNLYVSNSLFPTPWWVLGVVGDFWVVLVWWCYNSLVPVTVRHEKGIAVFCLVVRKGDIWIAA